MPEIIRLREIIHDTRASDGTWCTLPYPGHKKGCPNFPDCPDKYIDIRGFEEEDMDWYAIIEEFDLKVHAEEYMKKDWCKSLRQARCVLYWQPSVRKRLTKKTLDFFDQIDADIYLEIPEACGVNVFATMSKHGLYLKANPDYVYKIMFVGKFNDRIQNLSH